MRNNSSSILEVLNQINLKIGVESNEFKIKLITMKNRNEPSKSKMQHQVRQNRIKRFSSIKEDKIDNLFDRCESL